MGFISFKEYRSQVLECLKQAIIDYAKKHKIYIEVYELDYDWFVAAYSINGLDDCELLNLTNIKLEENTNIIRELDSITYEISKKAGSLFFIRFEEMLNLKIDNMSFWFLVDNTRVIETNLLKI